MTANSLRHRVGKWMQAHQITTSLLVLAGASLVFFFRDISLLHIANFYAEDATVLYQNIYAANPLRVFLTAFNGYLIVGQYLLAYVAVGVNFLIGNGLESLASVTYVMSCVFLGLCASLPYMLFWRNLGKSLALMVVLLTTLVPLASYDYAVIGTLSNLKFSFLYIAFLLIIYRTINYKTLSIRGVVTVDTLLLLCAVTNVTVVFLLPMIFLPYLGGWFQSLSARRLPKLTAPQLLAIGLVAVCMLYVAIALLKGIPKIPGYLDGPFDRHAILPIMDRSTTYSLLYPITAAFNNYFVGAMMLGLVIVVVVMLGRRNRDSFVVLAACWAIFLGTGLFVLNRPGIGDLYLTYGHKGGPDQFFYAQNMIFIFAAGWLAKDWFARLKLRRLVYVGAFLVAYLLLAVPHGTSFGGSSVVYRGMDDIDSNLSKACRQYAHQPKVIIQIYPTTYWQWQIDRDFACKH